MIVQFNSTDFKERSEKINVTNSFLSRWGFVVSTYLFGEEWGILKYIL